MSPTSRRPKEGPDKGWSWVVAFAAFFCSLVLSGIFRTSGVLFVAFIDAYGVTREEAAWPMVVCISVLNLTGPLSGFLGQRYGVRKVVMTGALIGAVGISSCFFTNSLTAVTILFGGVFGVGYGFVGTMLPVIVNMYFLNHRGTANGIANSGSCFGSIILPVLFELFIDAYGLTGCFLLTGGFVLNIAVAGALMRMPNFVFAIPLSSSPPIENGAVCKPNLVVQKETVVERSMKVASGDVKNTFEASFRQKDKRSYSETASADTLDKRDTLDDLNLTRSCETELQAELTEIVHPEKVFQSCYSPGLENFPEELPASLTTSGLSLYAENNGVAQDIGYELRNSAKEFENSLSDFRNTALNIAETSKSEDFLNRDDPSEVQISHLTAGCPARHSFSIHCVKRPLKNFKSAIPNAGPLRKHNYRFQNSSGEIGSSDLEDKTEIQKMVYNGLAVPIEEVEEPGCHPESSPLRDHDEETRINKKKTFHTVRSFRIVVTSPLFYITAINNVTFFFLLHMFLNVIVDYAQDRGVQEEDTKYVLFAFSMFDLIGQLSFGWVTDRKYLTRSTFVMCGIGGIGLVFLFLPYAKDFSSLIVVSSCYGILLGATLIMYPILLVDYLGIDLLPVAYGYLCFLNGFASFPRPFIIGYFRDNIGSYENMFSVMGVLSLLVSVLWTLEKCYLKRKMITL